MQAEENEDRGEIKLPTGKKAVHGWEIGIHHRVEISFGPEDMGLFKRLVYWLLQTKLKWKVEPPLDHDDQTRLGEHED